LPVTTSTQHDKGTDDGETSRLRQAVRKLCQQRRKLRKPQAANQQRGSESLIPLPGPEATHKAIITESQSAVPPELPMPAPCATLAWASCP